MRDGGGLMREYNIRDIALAPSGHRKIEWVRQFMPVLNRLNQEFTEQKPFAGKRVVLCLHLEAKTAYLTLQAGGAKVAVVASNPLSTQDDVVAALVENGISAYAWYKATDEEYKMHINQALDFKPDLIIDDGGDLVSALHTSRRELLDRIQGGAEETTTGILRLKAMAKEGKLCFPMMAVNDAPASIFLITVMEQGSRYGMQSQDYKPSGGGKTVCIVAMAGAAGLLYEPKG